MRQLPDHTSGFVSASTGGDSGSFSSGIGSCIPLIIEEFDVISLTGSAGVPFALSLLGRRVCLGEAEASDARGVSDSRLDGVDGLSVGEPGMASRSLDLPFPNPLNAALRLDDDFRSGDSARPYGWVLCLRRPNTVPNRLRLWRPLCLCDSWTLRSVPVLVSMGYSPHTRAALLTCLIISIGRRSRRRRC